MNFLVALRLQRGLSQRELAEMLGIAQTILSKLERGWFARCPAGLECKFRTVFGDQWGFEALMRAVPDLSTAVQSVGGQSDAHAS